MCVCTCEFEPCGPEWPAAVRFPTAIRENTLTVFVINQVGRRPRVVHVPALLSAFFIYRVINGLAGMKTVL